MPSQSLISSSGPFTVTVSNLPIGSGVSDRLVFTGSPDPRQLPFGPGNTPVSDQLCASHPAEEPNRTVGGFPSPFGVSALASWVIQRPLGSCTFLTVALPADIAGPQRGCHVAHEQDSTGQGAPFTPGTVVRSRPATILRPAPAASQRPVPTAPLTHPIGGGHLHEASWGVHSRSPITPRWLAASPEPESKTASRRSSPRPQPPDGTGTASASTPGFAPRGHPRSTPRRRQALAHWPEYYTYGISRTSKRCLPLHSCTLMSHIVRGGLDGDLLDTQLDELLGQLADGAGARGHVPHPAKPPRRFAGQPHAHLARRLGHIDGGDPLDH